MQSLPQTRADSGIDGAGAGDHDRPYYFGRRPCSSAPFPFSTRQFAHMLILRSRVQAGLFGAYDLAYLASVAPRAGGGNA